MFLLIRPLLPCLLFLGPVLSLSCYQSVQNANTPLTTSTPQACPSQFGGSCTKIVNYANGQITRECQSSNCTVGEGEYVSNVVSTTGGCTNTTSGMFCCCYGDGCNSAPQQLGPSALLPLIGTLALAMGSLLF